MLSGRSSHQGPRRGQRCRHQQRGPVRGLQQPARLGSDALVLVQGPVGCDPFSKPVAQDLTQPPRLQLRAHLERAGGSGRDHHPQVRRQHDRQGVGRVVDGPERGRFAEYVYLATVARELVLTFGLRARPDVRSSPARSPASLPPPVLCRRLVRGAEPHGSVHENLDRGSVAQRQAVHPQRLVQGQRQEPQEQAQGSRIGPGGTRRSRPCVLLGCLPSLY